MPQIGIIGLGYVGLPLAVAFGRSFKTIGFDINPSRIDQLSAGYDATLETDKEALESASLLTFTINEQDLQYCNVFIVTVPTPIDTFKKPDLNYLINASAMIGKYLKKGDVVVYESTVYPGCTEEDCVPVLEKFSQLAYNIDFFCGYSPERINPGDKERTLTKIKKITAGSTPQTAAFIDQLYSSIIEAGTYRASSIKVAEAAKAIENAQRDINISFVNELALIFDRMGLDTSEVLEAAGTKWNFLPFKPGLVGGHCIGVDPYYLVYKAQSLGYYPQVITSGRAVNDSMGVFVAKKVMKRLIANSFVLQSCRILILGLTFKENCPDIRNTKVIDVYNELTEFGLQVEVYDPWASPEEVFKEYDIQLLETIKNHQYDAVIVAVAHKQFLTIDYSGLKKTESAFIFDLKSFLPAEVSDLRL